MENICITGASSGIGLSCAEIFASNKCRLVIGARRLDRLKEHKEKLLSLGAKDVSILKLDLLDKKSCYKFCSETLKFFNNKLDVLINNAGLALGLDYIKDGDPSDWKTMIDTNILGTLYITKGFLPSMISKEKGHIIMIGSIAGHQVYEKGGVYCATKHALKAITQTLRLEINGTGLRLSSIDPGMVETEFSLVRLRDKQKAANVYKGLSPLTPKDIAECVFFAASRPSHVNIDDIIVMPTSQASVYKTHRK